MPDPRVREKELDQRENWTRYRTGPDIQLDQIYNWTRYTTGVNIELYHYTIE